MQGGTILRIFRGLICVGHVERTSRSGNVQTYMHGLHSAEGGDRVWTERRCTPNSKLEFYRRESHTTALAGYRGRSRAERVDSPSAHARESTRSVCCQQCRTRNTGRLSVEPVGGVLCAVCERHPPPPGATCGRESPGGKTCKMQTRRCHRSLQVLSPQVPPLPWQNRHVYFRQRVPLRAALEGGCIGRVPFAFRLALRRSSHVLAY